MVQIYGENNVDFVDFADESSLGQFGLLIDNPVVLVKNLGQRRLVLRTW
jgi:hypothetical protein